MMNKINLKETKAIAKAKSNKKIQKENIYLISNGKYIHSLYLYLIDVIFEINILYIH
jgi:hypothetical protein